MITLQFPLPGKPLNMNQAMHWADEARLKSAWKEASYFAARQLINTKAAERHQPFSVIRLSIPVTSLKIRRDPHNWFPTVKAIVDGLVMAVLFEDDSSEFLSTTEPTFHLRPTNIVVVTIKQTGPPT